MKFLLASLLVASDLSGASAQAPADKTVFLVQESAGPSLKSLEAALRGRGFKVVALPLPSRLRTVEEQGEWLAQRVHEKGEGQLYFVGQGPGSSVVRQYLSFYKPQHVVRFLAIAPPGQPSAAESGSKRVEGAVDFEEGSLAEAALAGRAVQKAVRFLETGRFARQAKQDPLAPFRPAWRDGLTWKVEHVRWSPSPAVAKDPPLLEERSVWVYTLAKGEAGHWRLRIAPDPAGREDFRVTEEYLADVGPDLSIRSLKHQPSVTRGLEPVEDLDDGPGFLPRQGPGVPLLYWPDWAGRFPRAYVIEPGRVIFRWEGRPTVELRWKRGEPWWSLGLVGEGRPGIRARLLED